MNTKLGKALQAKTANAASRLSEQKFQNFTRKIRSDGEPRPCYGWQQFCEKPYY